jgi:hypothetical protein
MHIDLFKKALKAANGRIELAQTKLNVKECKHLWKKGMKVEANGDKETLLISKA